MLRSMPCFLKMPERKPSSGMAVSQAPRWPTASLSSSAWAELARNSAMKPDSHADMAALLLRLQEKAPGVVSACGAVPLPPACGGEGLVAGGKAPATAGFAKEARALLPERRRNRPP